MEKHNIRLDQTRVAMAVREHLEDQFAQVVEHYGNAMTTDKPSTITITIKVTPNERHELFTTEVTAKTRLAPREPFESAIFAGRDENGLYEAVEFDPRLLNKVAPSEAPVG